MFSLNIKDLIGEATEYDKKLALEEKKPKSWCKSVSAFANTFGGALIFGISNEGMVVGLENPEANAEKISEVIKTRLNPIPEFKLRFHKSKYGKVLVVLDVYKGDETPYYYSGDGVLEALDDAEYSGSVISLIENGEAFIKRNCKMKWRKTANSREEMPDGSVIQDRDPLTVPSTRRNPVLADVFNRLGYMERKGSGFGKIISGYELQINFNENKRPSFRSDRYQFTVVMPNLNYDVQSSPNLCVNCS